MRRIAELDSDRIPEVLDDLTLNVDRQELNFAIVDPDALQCLQQLLDEGCSEWGMDNLFVIDEACAVRLDCNVDPHNDAAHVDKHGLFREAFVLVIDSIPGDGFEPADGSQNLLYGYKWGLSENLKKGDLYMFDARHAHAAMISGEVQLVTMWVKPRPSNTPS